MRGPNSEPPYGNCSASHQTQPHSEKSNYVFGDKFSYGDIQKYMDICFQRASRIEFLSVKKWCSANFLTRNRNTFFGKTCKVRKISGWLWDFLLENLKLKKLWWCPPERMDEYKKLYARNNILKKNKKEFQILHFVSFTFWSKFRFLGTALRRFSQCFFFLFFDRHFYSVPPLPPATIKKLLTVLIHDEV